MHIRQIEGDAEIDAVVSLVRAAWAARVDQRSSGHRFDRASLQELLAEGAVVLVGLEQGAIVGTATVVPAGKTAEITKVSSAPHAFGSGIGAALVRSAEAFARDSGATEALLAVSAYQADLVRWYARLGYVVATDRTYGHAAPSSPSPIVMVRSLNPASPSSDPVGSPGPVEQAAAIVLSGGLVAMPTETVYGLAADASDPLAVRSVFATKGRPVDHPLIVHLASAASLPVWAEVSEDARRLAARFWPGPLTMVLSRQAHVLDEVTGGRDTVAIRVPRHPLALALISLCGPHAGLVAPSANPFGAVSPTSADHVRADGLVETIVDGGECSIGVESTIVELVDGGAQVLRAGAISAEELAAVLGRPVQAEATGQSRAPGMLASHYSPRAAVLIVEPGAPVPEGDWGRVGYLGPGRGPAESIALSPPVPYTADTLAPVLYARLREADELGLGLLLVEPPSSGALANAVLDRLTRASAR
jgi:L-threonylcarbamoyladenylate synthase